MQKRFRLVGLLALFFTHQLTLSAQPGNIRLNCQGGQRVRGLEDRWSPWSTCPSPYQVTGLQRVDLLGSHSAPTAHVNDFQCNDQGCRAWCIGSPCTVEARCCSIVVDAENAKPAPQ